jgi:gas vesicle protein
MNYQRVLIGVAIGTAVAGLGILFFHPAGKKLRKKAVDIGLDAADKLIDLLRTTLPVEETEKVQTPEPERSRTRTSQVVTES